MTPNYLILVSGVFLACLTVDTDARRGGGFRGGSSYRSSSRSTSRSRYSGGSYRTSRYTGAIAAGLVVRGRTRYDTRHYAYDADYDSSDDPTVCYSHGSGLAENGSYVSEIGYFVCPYDYDDALTDTYCCGPRDRETCCGFWDDGGRMAGAIIGILIAIGAFIIVIACIIKVMR